MKVKILKEGGYNEAILGLSLSYNIPEGKAAEVAERIYNNDGGHNKFLESIVVWLDIDAPRYWWAEFDTYRVGVTKQSECYANDTERKLTLADFEYPICDFTLELLNSFIEDKNFMAVKIELPESFLQRRIVCTNYKTLRNMVAQRKNHKLREWHIFIDALKSLEHWRFIEQGGNDYASV